MYISFDAPEIDEYTNGFPGYWALMLIGSVAKNFQVDALATTYVRLVEAALVEYRLGQVKLKEYWNTHHSVNISALNRSISHFESCLLNMYRAVRCFTRMRRHKDLPESMRLVLSVERPRFVADQVLDQLRNFRHAIHHLDSRVMNGHIQQGQSIALMPSGPEIPHSTEPNQTIKTIDRLVVGNDELKFATLVVWLTEMARFAEKIAAYQPTS